jgi:hypothetical protein
MTLTNIYLKATLQVAKDAKRMLVSAIGM